MLKNIKDEQQVTPRRIQRKRSKGFRLQDASTNPNGVVYVGRPGKWGNPFTVAEYGKRLALFNYRGQISGLLLVSPNALDELRDKDLACWCREGSLCHADILLELANR